MKKTLLIIFTLSCGCANINKYEITDVSEKNVKENSCYNIGETDYYEGYEPLQSDPFYHSDGYSSDNVKLAKKNWNPAYEYRCPSNDKNIKLKREIKVASIGYPDICSHTYKTGHVNTGSSTSVNCYGSSCYANTTNHGYDTYATEYYECTAIKSLVEVKFYEKNKYMGKIRDKYWTKTDSEKTMNDFTTEFLDNLKDIGNQKLKQAEEH
jgi:hypothetical protein